MTMEPPSCPACLLSYSAHDATAHKMASASAHLLAAAEAERSADARFTFVDLYILYFPRAYRHEWHRARRYEKAKAQLYIYTTQRDALCNWHTSSIQHEYDYHYGADATTQSLRDFIERDYERNRWHAELLPTPIGSEL